MTLMQLLTHVVMLVVGSLSPDNGTFWMPPGKSTVSAEVDWLFYLILAISTFFFVLIVGVMVVFIVKYRYKEGEEAQASASHNLPLELTWTIIPLILVGFIFYFGFDSYLNMSTAPANSYEIKVRAQKWSWAFVYPNGYEDSNLHVPVNQPIALTMSSADVIHSLYVPAFRIKNDVLPGRYSKAWFEATEAGEYDLFCAEYCGTSHSNMLATVVVHPEGEFEPWLVKASNFLETMTPIDAGRKLYQARGCTQRHSVDGTPKTGPTFKGVWGKTEFLTNGETVVVDENYVRESILEPAVKVLKGYEAVMPTYQGRFTDPEIDAVIEYIKSLSQEEE